MGVVLDRKVRRRLGIYTSRDLARRSGLPFGQVDTWTRRHILDPCVPARGQGSTRYYDDRALAVARVIAALTRRGMAHRIISAAAAAVRDRQTPTWAGPWCVLVDPDPDDVADLATRLGVPVLVISTR